MTDTRSPRSLVSELDWSDESPSLCGDFKCKNGQTISLTSLCNGNQECRDGSDEKKSLCDQFGNKTSSVSMYGSECKNQTDLENAKWKVSQGNCIEPIYLIGYPWMCNGKCISRDKPCNNKCHWEPRYRCNTFTKQMLKLFLRVFNPQSKICEKENHSCLRCISALSAFPGKTHLRFAARALDFIENSRNIMEEFNLRTPFSIKSHPDLWRFTNVWPPAVSGV